MKQYDNVRVTEDGLGAWNEPKIKPDFDTKLDAGERGTLLREGPSGDDGGAWWLAVFRAPAGTEAAVYALVPEKSLEIES